MINKVLVLIPPHSINEKYSLWRTREMRRTYFPIYEGYAAGVIAERHEVKVIDYTLEEFSMAGFDADLSAFDPDLVAVMTHLYTFDLVEQFESAKLLAEHIRAGFPGKLISLGGAYGSVLPEEAMKHACFDFVVLGEGENVYPRLLDALSGGGDLSAIDGLGFREGERIRIRPKTEYVMDLDSIPPPARHLFRFEEYFSYPERMNFRYPEKCRRYAQVLTSRSCPGNCIFCINPTVFGRKYRVRAPEAVLEEIDHLVERWGIGEIHFWDQNLTFDRPRAVRIFQGLIDRGHRLSWFAGQGVAVYTLDDGLLELMKESGFYRAILAVESGDEQVLNRIIGKPTKIRQVYSAVRKCKELELETVGFFMIGLPGETIEQVRKTVSFAEELDLDYVVFSVATPHPGTRLLKVCKERGILSPDVDPERLYRSQGAIVTGEFNPGLMEEYRVREWDRINFRTEEKRRKICRMFGMTPAELDALRAKTHMRIAA